MMRASLRPKGVAAGELARARACNGSTDARRFGALADGCSTGVLTAANWVDVTTETVSTDTESGALAGRRMSGLLAATASGIGTAERTWGRATSGRARNIGTVKKTVDTTAAPDIRSRSHF